jgi:hypothetical protein
MKVSSDMKMVLIEYHLKKPIINGFYELLGKLDTLSQAEYRHGNLLAYASR